MAHPLFSVFLVLLTITFFWQAQLNKTIPQPFTKNFKKEEQLIARNEYLVLLEQEHRQDALELLKELHLELIGPVGEWLHVGLKKSLEVQEMTALSTQEALDADNMIALLESHPFIHTAHLNYSEPDEGGCRSCLTDEKTNDVALVIPKDPLYREQWHLSGKKGIHMPQAWALTKGNPKTVIAVVDRNFSLDDPDFNPLLCASRRYYYDNVLDYMPQQRRLAQNDDYAHGLAVLNVLAPCTDNGVGLAGIDWYAQVSAVDTKGDKTLSGRLFGVMWAAGIDLCTFGIASCPLGSAFKKNQHPADIINASFGFSGNFLKDPPFGPVLDMLGPINRQGRIVVASAGNEGINADRRLPGAAGGIISVGASTIDGKSPAYANFGRSIDVLAPGDNILGLIEGQMVSLDGTSFATPIVSGIVSLMRSVNPSLSWKHAEYILKKTAQPIPCDNYCPATMANNIQKECQELCCEGEKTICAAGIVDAFAAVAMAKAGIPKTPLIDVDDYYLALSKESGLKTKLIVKNWGDATADVHLKKTEAFLKIYPEQFSLPAMKNGQPSTKEILVYYDKNATSPVILSLVLESFSGKSGVSDSIEAIVEIVPDRPQAL